MKYLAPFLALALFSCAPPALAATGVTVQGANGKQLTVNSDGSITVQGTITITPGGVAALTPTDRGGTITAGGTAQPLAALNTSRKQLCVQNPPEATENLYLSATTTATVAGAGNSASLSPGAQWCAASSGFVYQTAISVIATTTGHRWIATEGQ